HRPLRLTEGDPVAPELNPHRLTVSAILGEQIALQFRPRHRSHPFDGHGPDVEAPAAPDRDCRRGGADRGDIAGCADRPPQAPTLSDGEAHYPLVVADGAALLVDDPAGPEALGSHLGEKGPVVTAADETDIHRLGFGSGAEAQFGRPGPGLGLG